MKQILPKFTHTQFRVAITMVPAAMTLCGCAELGHPLALEAVGPEPNTVVQPEAEGRGMLVVFSAYDANPRYYSDDAQAAQFTGYQLFARDEWRPRFIGNNDSTVAAEPEAVALRAGTYRVLAQAGDIGLVSVPVVIKSQQTTVVRLEKGAPPAYDTSEAKTNFVTLPDGLVVGWRAN